MPLFFLHFFFAAFSLTFLLSLFLRHAFSAAAISPVFAEMMATYFIEMPLLRR